MVLLAAALFGCGEDADASMMDGAACLEASYVWASCSEEPQHIARRVPLAELCEEYECPADWNAALAAAAACNGEPDAGFMSCWRTSTECGVNRLVANRGPDPRIVYYDPTTGELIGAAIQLTDASQECVVSEKIAGERAPICCESDGGS